MADFILFLIAIVIFGLFMFFLYKKSISNYEKILCIIYYLIVAAPYIFYLLDKFNVPTFLGYAKNVDSKAWLELLLNYYCAIITALIGVGGVLITIYFSVRQWKKDFSSRSLPYMIVNQLYKNTNKDIFAFLENKTIKNDNKNFKYYEYKLRKIYFIVEEENIKMISSLSLEDRKLLENNGRYFKEVTSGGYIEAQNNFISLPMEIINVGVGTAINLRIGFNKVISGKKNQERKYIVPINAAVNEKIYINIIFKDVKDSDLGNYELEFLYNDINKNKYKQVYEIAVMNDNNIYCASLDLKGNEKQELL